MKTSTLCSHRLQNFYQQIMPLKIGSFVRTLKIWVAALLGVVWLPLASGVTHAQKSVQTEVVNQAQVKLLVFGDSLTAGYNLPESESFAVVLETMLRQEGFHASVASASVSGSTSSEGIDRVDWLLEDDPDIIFLALGANDFLRGLRPKDTKANLELILQRFIEAKKTVILAGLYAPRNLGPDYVEEFEAIYPDLASHYDVVFLPFLLDGVALVPELNLPDGIHPNPKGVGVMVRHALPMIKEVVLRSRAE